MKLELVIVAVVVALVLFRDELFGPSAQPSASGGFNYGGLSGGFSWSTPPPTPNPSVVPPQAAPTTHWDTINTLLQQGGQAYRDYLGSRR